MEDRAFVEKRKYVRFDLEVKIKFQILQQGKDKGQVPSESVSAITKNLSVEGIRFISDVRVELGSIIRMEILLPTQTQPLHLEGQVKWSQSLKQPDGKELFETGVKLFTIEKSDENRFMGYVYDKTIQNMGKYLSL